MNTLKKIGGFRISNMKKSQNLEKADLKKKLKQLACLMQKPKI